MATISTCTTNAIMRNFDFANPDPPAACCALRGLSTKCAFVLPARSRLSSFSFVFVCKLIHSAMRMLVAAAATVLLFVSWQASALQLATSSAWSCVIVQDGSVECELAPRARPECGPLNSISPVVLRLGRIQRWTSAACAQGLCSDSLQPRRQPVLRRGVLPALLATRVAYVAAAAWCVARAACDSCGLPCCCGVVRCPLLAARSAFPCCC